MTHPHAESRALLALQNAATMAKIAKIEKENAGIALDLVIVGGTKRAIELRTNEYLQALNNFAKRTIAYGQTWDAYTMGGVGHE